MIFPHTHTHKKYPYHTKLKTNIRQFSLLLPIIHLHFNVSDEAEPEAWENFRFPPPNPRK